MLRRIIARLRRRQIKMRLGLINIRNTPDMPRFKVVQDASLMRKEGVDIGWFNEIREKDDHEDVRTGLGHNWKVAFWYPISTPIARLRSRWFLLGTEVVVLHEAFGRIPTPRRYLVRMNIRPRFRLKRLKIAVFGMHMINGGFNDEHPQTRTERAQLWNDSWATIKLEMLKAQAEGYVVIWAGDVNRLKMAKWLAGQEWIWNQGILKMAGSTAGTEWHMKVDDTWERNDVNTDKHAIFADITLWKEIRR